MLEACTSMAFFSIVVVTASLALAAIALSDAEAVTSIFPAIGILSSGLYGFRVAESGAGAGWAGGLIA
jgi:hypothetical protein